MITYKVTNQKLFDQKVDDITLHNMSYDGNSFHGTVSIEIDGEWNDITGEHREFDYEEEYGFILVS